MLGQRVAAGAALLQLREHAGGALVDEMLGQCAAVVGAAEAFAQFFASEAALSLALQAGDFIGARVAQRRRGVKGEAWRTLLRDDFHPRLERMWSEQTYLHPRALLGFFPCYALGNEIIAEWLRRRGVS